MLSLVLLVVVAFVVGLFVTARWAPGSVARQIVFVVVATGVFVGLIGYFGFGLRGMELLETVVSWALLLPAVVLGNVVRERVSPKTRL